MNISEKDKEIIWHPYTQMQIAPESIPIIKGEREYLFDDKGNKYIDAISSWWVTIHGHSHPYIAQKVFEQMNILEHVIFAGFTHPQAILLAERLLKLLPQNQKKVFYSDNGSTAVEVAIKMALQFYSNQNIHKDTIVAFHHSYHGDTFGAMSVSQRSIFTEHFNPYLFDVKFIEPPFYDKEEKSLAELKEIIKSNNIAAFIFEPIIQGAGGMLMHNPAGLDKVLKLCHQHSILTIADEVMTGFGRSGKMFATNYLNELPDIYCLSKGLTGGVMALGVTTCTQDIYNKFLSEDKTKTLYHGHSFTANPIACTAALASLDLFEREKTMEKVLHISEKHTTFKHKISHHPLIKEIRHQGVILAIEIKNKGNTSYTNNLRDNIYNYFLNHGIIIRPLGNILYINPPYCISDDNLDYIYNTIIKYISELKM
jgi:adenosylmethionine-8-amino-7-oxononanoate aminotransferase